MHSYFSDREHGSQPRVIEDISSDVWGGLVVLIHLLISNDSFGVGYPEMCSDGYGVAGLDKRAMALAIRAEIPALNWPIDMHNLVWQFDDNKMPPTLAILDLIEFCHRAIGKPIQQDFHPYYGHYHFAYERAEGQREFQIEIERIFARSGLAYELKASGRIERLAPPTLRETLQSAEFQSGDVHLDSMLSTARSKFLDPNPTVRVEAVEKLWDGWERLKSIEVPTDKKKSTGVLLDKVTSEPYFREKLEQEAITLTEIGNKYMIRHSERDKLPLDSSEQVDYFFGRLFALINLLLRSR